MTPRSAQLHICSDTCSGSRATQIRVKIHKACCAAATGIMDHDDVAVNVLMQQTRECLRTRVRILGSLRMGRVIAQQNEGSMLQNNCCGSCGKLLMRVTALHDSSTSAQVRTQGTSCV
jgi:hypothetical protein